MPKYPHLPLRVTEDQLRWLDTQAAKAGVNRSKWVKARLFGAVGIGDRPSTSPVSGSASAASLKDTRGDGGDRQEHGDREASRREAKCLSSGCIGVVEKVGAAITKTLETVPDSGEQYTPSNPLDRVREVAVLTSKLLHLLSQLEPETERDQELVKEVWAIASELQRKCAIAGRGERRRGRSSR